MPRPNSRARLTKNTTAMVDSRIDGSCGRRPITNTSIASATARTAIVAIQTQVGMFTYDLR